MNNCPIGLLCSELSKNEESCDNQESCQNLARPWELPYKLEAMCFYFNNKREVKLILFVLDFESTYPYDSYSQEFYEIRAAGWAKADPLPYRYYLDNGQYRREVVEQFNPNYLEFLLPPRYLNFPRLFHLRNLDPRLKLHFSPPEELPYQYDLELRCLKVIATCYQRKYTDRRRNQYVIECTYGRPVDLPYNYVYDKEANLGVLLVTQEVYLDGKKIFAPASLLPE
ncbi:hypothetical protein Sta7437_4822 (plasmid) [Stanieria cyanosphaera PCC 7437]|uniref:Uncharacterized protein n=1 Tax=Stanieria cyanosphaera (strain ATCC 29371 / PCC 7437) TaxID=111780 RepID=K9Y1H3_STAC7|nr:hypothetical protein [Stanieria cyanosphaera]AFZ38256.1 hypothetical protein Sta7437_4822 [Stanieria cyanosphaera PCC 7437]